MASDAVFQPKTIPPTAATKFADSLADYAFRAEYWGIVRTVEREVQDTALAACNGRPFGPEATSLIETAARGFVRQATAGTIRSVMCGLAAHCDSIIELSLGLALGMIARAKGCAVLYDFGGQRVFGDPDGDITVRIQPQVCFEFYRVDFLLSMQFTKGSDGDLQVFTKQLVVECDGFEFHDKTREQAGRDRERDRYPVSWPERVSLHRK